MRAVNRRPLSATTLTELHALTNTVIQDPDPAARAKSLWSQQGTKARQAAFDEVKATLRAMAGGRDRCMYCEDNEGTDIEHFWPKQGWPQRAFDWENYLWACGHCNSNFKRALFPLTGGLPDLIDPSEAQDDPKNHLLLLPSSGEYQPKQGSHRGKKSIEVFDLNGTRTGRRLPEGRKGTLLKLSLLVLEFDRAFTAGESKMAEDAREAILGEPFCAVWRYLIDMALSPAGQQVLRPGVADAVSRHGMGCW